LDQQFTRPEKETAQTDEEVAGNKPTFLDRLKAL
jgi:hypothetical protein